MRKLIAQKSLIIYMLIQRAVNDYVFGTAQNIKKKKKKKKNTQHLSISNNAALAKLTDHTYLIDNGPELKSFTTY